MSREIGVWLSEARIGSETDTSLLSECEFVQIDETTRLYFRPFEGAHEERHGFHFAAVLNIGGGTNADRWDETPAKHVDTRVRVEFTFSGVALFDGIRHLYLNRGDDLGYLYYPNVEALAATLKALRDLELRFCLDVT